MFKKTECDHCKNEYDETFSECPYCHAPNESLDPNFKNIQMMSWPKQAGLFAMGLGGFELLGILISLIFSATGLAKLETALVNMLLNTIAYTVLFVCLLLIANKDLIKIGKSFKSWMPYVAGACCFGFIIVTGIIYSYILNAAGVKIINNDNQQSIDVTTRNFTLTSMIIFGIVGPICEELTYRVGLFSFLKRISKWLAYPAAILVFALIHFNFTATSLTNELFNLPYYILAGFALTFTYDKFGFAGSTVAHILNNIISLIPAAVALGVFH